jgi:integration host factor subunit alpha
MNTSVTKKELAKKLSTKLNISQILAQKAIQETFYIIEEELKARRRVVISKFGTFSLKERKARIGRNPRTKEAIPIKARTIPYLKFSKKLLNDFSNDKR